MFDGLWQSRKFRVLVLDMTVSLILYFVGKYAAWLADDVIFLVGAIQPVFLCMIGGIAYEDGQAKRVGSHPAQLAARARSDNLVMVTPNDHLTAMGEPESAGMAVEIDPAITTLTEDIAQGLGV